ncbi:MULTISPECIES: CDP-alcohol phosphatidyltransferase family protein [Microbulbifer]|uniref:CDP-alcohol phosphatidyltransferase family protein n=1 Tax=Microbulbifer TaxID=48073 RepID=UPI001E506277|nr:MULTISPECIES: CDP-alcohol phosphatidyltransferase family protein [Microbulbifer]UHQ54014.1 CDP-alcohol phosphatidyltransferase family protein [Microbulbifer sp. YPW16]
MTETPATTPWRHVPNLLSALRILLIPVIIWLSLNQYAEAALAAFMVGALTDLLDGQLARRCGWHSHLGAMLDPVADKLFVLCLMPLIWQLSSVLALFVWLVIIRYTLQLSVFPVLMGWLKRPFKVAPRLVPKVATLVAFLVLGLGFAQPVALEWTPHYTHTGNFFGRSIQAASAFGCLLEAWVLVTFLPRYAQIIVGTHDTFE